GAGALLAGAGGADGAGEVPLEAGDAAVGGFVRAEKLEERFVGGALEVGRLGAERGFEAGAEAGATAGGLGPSSRREPGQGQEAESLRLRRRGRQDPGEPPGDLVVRIAGDGAEREPGEAVRAQIAAEL